MRSVPDWILQKGTDDAGGSRVARLSFLFAGFYFLYGYWLLPVLTDWVSFAVDEGYTSYAASRWVRGEWPHRDFFFLWSPGIIWLHGLVQWLGGGWLIERSVTLLASSGTTLICLVWADRFRLKKTSRMLLFFLLLVWGFSLWNIPYSSWYSVFAALLASLLLPRRAILAGMTLGLSFWFKQNVGILAAAGAFAALWLRGEKREARLLLFATVGMIGLPFLSFLTGGVAALNAAIEQIFLFPLQYRKLMQEPLPMHTLAGPLTCYGLWIFSLYLINKNEARRGTKALLQFAWVAYASYRWSQEGYGFAAGVFYLLSLAAWPMGLLLVHELKDKDRRSFLLFLLPAAGAFLQVYPRADFQHFLFVFPVSALLLVRFSAWLAEKYPRRPALWLHAPLIGMLICGLPFQIRLNHVRLAGERDPYGRIAIGEALALNREMHEVGDFLRSRGLNPGDPVLVLPNANHFYHLEKFRNPTPHNQFFPGYVEAYGHRQEDVLAEFERAGGRFLVFQKRSGTDRNVPAIYREMLDRYRSVGDFPVHFGVWQRKP